MSDKIHCHTRLNVTHFDSRLRLWIPAHSALDCYKVLIRLLEWAGGETTCKGMDEEEKEEEERLDRGDSHWLADSMTLPPVSHCEKQHSTLGSTGETQDGEGLFTYAKCRNKNPLIQSMHLLSLTWIIFIKMAVTNPHFSTRELFTLGMMCKSK